MKLMGYELPLGISITQHAPEMVDGFVENGFEYFEVGIPACLNREDAPKMPWRGHEETLVNTKLPLVEKIFSHNLRVWSVPSPVRLRLGRCALRRSGARRGLRIPEARNRPHEVLGAADLRAARLSRARFDRAARSSHCAEPSAPCASWTNTPPATAHASRWKTCRARAWRIRRLKRAQWRRRRAMCRSASTSTTFSAKAMRIS